MELFTLKTAVLALFMSLATIHPGVPSDATTHKLEAGKVQYRIDTHQHLIPPFYAQQLKELQLKSGGAPIPEWSEQSALNFMAMSNITKSILSISSPGALIANNVLAARRLARQLNEYSHDLQQRHPESFGFFATLTLPDVEGSVEEAKYALDVLQAYGVVLMGNSGATYLGDSSFEPLMEVLNERNAVVFVHPDDLPGQGVEGVPAYIVDFLLDTTRAATNLLLSNTLDKYPNIKFILSHGGGFLPYAAYRIGPSIAAIRKVKSSVVMAQMKRFFFDTALSASPTSLPSLLALAENHIIYGSDFPFISPQIVGRFNDILASFPGLSGKLNQVNELTPKSLFSRNNSN